MDDVAGANLLTGEPDPFTPEPLDGVEPPEGFEDDEDQFDMILASDNDGEENTGGDDDADPEGEDEIASLIKQYDGDPRKIAEALREARAAKPAVEPAPEPDREPEPEPQKADDAPKVDPETGLPLDEYGLVVIPEAYFLGPYADQVRTTFEQNPAALVDFLRSAGYSEDQARQYAQDAYDTDDYSRWVNAFVQEKKAGWQSAYRAEREKKQAEAETAEGGRIELLIPKQTEEVARVGGLILQRYGLTAETGQVFIKAVHATAKEILTRRRLAGQIGNVEQYEPKIVRGLYDDAIRALSESGQLDDLLVQSRKAPAASKSPLAGAGVKSSGGGAVDKAPGTTPTGPVKLNQAGMTFLKTMNTLARNSGEPLVTAEQLVKDYPQYRG